MVRRERLTRVGQPRESQGSKIREERAMSDSQPEDTTQYKVVMNHEEQYSIWPADRKNPEGWTDAGKTGLKAECLAYIETVWTDMRPLSVRKRMDAAAAPTEPAD